MEMIQDAVSRAIDEVNGLLPTERRLTKSPETVLSGDGALLDSLGLVNFIVVVESTVAEKLGVSINLISEDSMARQPNPFSTIRSLTEYTLELTQKDSHGPR